MGALVDTGCGAGAVVSSLAPSSMTPPLLLLCAWSLDSAMATCRRSTSVLLPTDNLEIVGAAYKPRPPSKELIWGRGGRAWRGRERTKEDSTLHSGM